MPRRTHHRPATTADSASVRAARAVQEALDSRDNGGDTAEHEQPGRK